MTLFRKAVPPWMHAAMLCSIFGAPACTAETSPSDSKPVEPASLTELDRDLGLGAEGRDVLAVFEYLRSFGYFPNADIANRYPAWRPVAETPADPLVFDERMVDATLALQRNSGLFETGIVDEPTRVLLRTPRCGEPDNIPDLDPSDKFAYWGSRWPTSNISWRVLNGENNVTVAQARAEAALAFDSWARATTLTFTQLTTTTADIEIRFRNDVPGGLLAQQPVPPPGTGAAGDINIDSDFDWTTTGQAGMRDLRTIMLHEIGHALGLHHSSFPGATMLSNVPVLDRTLDIDDRVGISSLYDVFQQVPGSAFDIAAEAQGGSVWAIGTDFGIYKWNGSNSWTAAPGSAVAIAVGPTGTPWVVNSIGEIYRRTSASPTSGSWVLVPGCASDIAIGRNGVVWAIGCDLAGAGFNIWRWNGSGWSAADGAAVRIAVDQNGVPWVVDALGQTFQRLSSAAGNVGWTQLPGCGQDIGIGDGNYAWKIGCDEEPGGFGIHVFNQQAGIGGGNPTPAIPPTWRKVVGAGVAITVGLRGTPWIVSDNGSVFRAPDVS